MTVDDSSRDPTSCGGFITKGEMFQEGLERSIPLGTSSMDEGLLYDRIDSLDIEDRLEVIQRLALSLTDEFYHRFVDALVITLVSGILDVTGWTRLAIKAAVVVCSERDLPISFRNGDRTISPVSYPKEGPLLEMFVESILTGSWA